MNLSNIFILNNIFSETIRKKMISDSKKLIKLRENIWFCPDITTHKHFKKQIEKLALQSAEKIKSNLKIKNSWVAYGTGEIERDFHNHDSHYSLVYYMKTNKNNSGTLFKDRFIKVDQNDALVFESILYHKVPKYFPYEERRTLVMELNRV
jgi:hypothetical protein